MNTANRITINWFKEIAVVLGICVVVFGTMAAMIVFGIQVMLS